MARASRFAPWWPPSSGTTLRPVVRDRDDRRFVALVREMWAEQADEDAGGADADDGRAGPEQRREMGREALVGDIGVAFERRGAVERCAGQGRRDAARERHLARVQDRDGGSLQRHAAPRLWTMIMEK